MTEPTRGAREPWWQDPNFVDTAATRCFLVGSGVERRVDKLGLSYEKGWCECNCRWRWTEINYDAPEVDTLDRLDEEYDNHRRFQPRTHATPRLGPWH